MSLSFSSAKDNKQERNIKSKNDFSVKSNGEQNLNINLSNPDNTNLESSEIYRTLNFNSYTDSRGNSRINMPVASEHLIAYFPNFMSTANPDISSSGLVRYDDSKIAYDQSGNITDRETYRLLRHGTPYSCLGVNNSMATHFNGKTDFYGSETAPIRIPTGDEPVTVSIWFKLVDNLDSYSNFSKDGNGTLVSYGDVKTSKVNKDLWTK